MAVGEVATFESAAVNSDLHFKIGRNLELEGLQGCPSPHSNKHHDSELDDLILYVLRRQVPETTMCTMMRQLRGLVLHSVIVCVIAGYHTLYNW